MVKRLLALLLSFAMLFTLSPMVLAEDTADVQNSAEEATESKTGETGGSQDDDTEIVDYPVVDVTLETTADPGIMPITLDNNVVDQKAGAHEKWIDRLNISESAQTFYKVLELASNNDGVDDWLIDDEYYDINGVDIPVADEPKVGDFVRRTAHYSDGSTSKYTGIIAAVCKNVSGAERNNFDSGPVSFEWNSMYAAYGAFDRDHPEVFWENKSLGYMQSTLQTADDLYTVFLTVILKDDGERDLRNSHFAESSSPEDAIKSAIVGMNQNVDKILKELEGDETRYEMVAYFNNWLTHNNEYNTTNDLSSEDNPWDMRECVNALQGKEGLDGPVCESYARAFKVLCDRVKIPCVLVDGKAKSSIEDAGGAHMWNYAQMEDGKWYAVDTTWDDPTGGTGGKVSGNEYDKWLLLGSNTNVGNNLTFIQSHPVNNSPWVDGVAFPNGPELSQTDYVRELELKYPDTPQTAVIGDSITLEPTVRNVRIGLRNNTLTYSVIEPENLPTGLNLGTNGVITGTFEAASDPVTVTVQVTDEESKTATATLQFPKVEKKENTVTFTNPVDTFYKDGEQDPNVTFTANATAGTVTFKYKQADQGEDTFTDTAPTEVGEYVVRASTDGTDQYKSAHADHQFSIVQKAIDSITVEGAGTIKRYVEGQSVNPEELTVTATYNDGSERTLGSDEFDVSPAKFETAGQIQVTVTADGKTATFTVTVVERKVESIEVNGPTKKEYTALETVDAYEITVRATYNDGTTETVTGFTVTYPNGECFHVGDTSVTVSYEGMTETITGFNVKPKQITVTPNWGTTDFPFSGEPITVQITNLPEHVTAEYTGNEAIYVGTYMATANLTTDNKDYSVTTGSVTQEWSITAADQKPTLRNTSLCVGNQLNLNTLVTLQEGVTVEPSFSMDNSEYASLEGTVLKATEVTGEVTVNVEIPAVDLNEDGTPEFKAFTGTLTVTVTVKDTKDLTVTTRRPFPRRSATTRSRCRWRPMTQSTPATRTLRSPQSPSPVQ